MVAATQGDLQIARVLLENGANVNAHDEAMIGDIALHEAAAAGTYQMVQLLIDGGADPTIAGWMQVTAIHRAEARTDSQRDFIVELLRHATLGVTKSRKST